MSFKSFSSGLGNSKNTPANDVVKPGELHDQPGSAAAKAPIGDKPATKS